MELDLDPNLIIYRYLFIKSIFNHPREKANHLNEINMFLYQYRYIGTYGEIFLFGICSNEIGKTRATNLKISLVPVLSSIDQICQHCSLPVGTGTLTIWFLILT
jgi:hypothetical protein